MEVWSCGGRGGRCWRREGHVRGCVWLMAVSIGALLLCLAVAPSDALADLAWGTGVEAALPANASATPNVTLSSVSCVSAGNCSAVGNYYDGASYQGLLLSESSGTWGTGIEAALPANAAASPNVSLSSVSCASVGNCSAVGVYDDSSNEQQGLLLSESSGTWGTGVEAALPAYAGTPPLVHLTSVSCASAGNCAAVGYYYSNADTTGPSYQGLLLSESSGTWDTGVKAGLPVNRRVEDGPDVTLSSVSCASAGNCAAIGRYLDSSSSEQGLLLSESSGTWGTGIEAALPANGEIADLDPGSVSCASTGNCTAVGDYLDGSKGFEGLLLSESSGTWGTGIEATLPADAATDAGSSAYSVSCSSVGNCSAVGDYSESSGYEGLLLSESSGTWGTGVGAAPPANSSTNPDAFLDSVSCGSVGNCAAVGNYVDSSNHEQGLLLGESLETWGPSLEAALPASAGANPDVNLSSVSCGSVGNCAAVGDYVDSSGTDQGLLLSGVPACDTSWTGAASDGLYSDAGNWSAGVPNGNRGCITLPGTYTVHVQGAPPAATVLTVGGSSGTQTLSLESTCSGPAALTTSSGMSIGSHGTLLLTNADGCANNATLAIPSGTLTNGGTIDVLAAAGGTRNIQGSILNNGTIDLDSGATLNVSGGGVFTNSGTVAATGSGQIFQTGGTFTQGNGTLNGAEPVLLDDAALDYTGIGKGTVTEHGNSTLSGNLAPGQSLQLESTCSEPAVLSDASSLTNRGKITLTNGDSCANNASLALNGGAGTLTNNGTIVVLAGVGGSRNLTGSLVQTSAGKYHTSVSPSGVLNVSGSQTLAGTYGAKPHPTTATVGQTFQVIQGSLSGTFATETGGDITDSGLYYQPTYPLSPSCSGGFAACVVLVVKQATMTLSPPSVPPSGTLGVSGTSWPTNDTLTITFTDALKVRTTYATTPTDGSGNFTENITIPSTAAAGTAKVLVTSKLTGARYQKTVTVS